MGEVYRADDLKLGCPVALKLLPADIKQHRRRLAMLLEEARMARKVSHPNVCRVHDIGIHCNGDGSQLHFVSMEYIDGEDLSSLLRRIGRLPQAKALDVAQDLCAGLAAIHACGLLHRDIKPSNVMLDNQGRVRLTDFGLLIADSEAMDLAGTPAYMAPEQLTQRLTTIRSDIYSLGLVLYEIFTGRRAFEGQSPREMAWSQLQCLPEAPSLLVEHLSPDIERLVLTCLEKVPERRIPSVDVMIQALSQIVDGPNGGTIPLGQGEKVLRAILACDLISQPNNIGSSDNPRANALRARAERLEQDLRTHHGGQPIHTVHGMMFLFERPSQALQFALAYHQRLASTQRRSDNHLKARIGIHLGEILLQRSSVETFLNDGPVEVEGQAQSITQHLMSLAEEGQTLISSGAFELARRSSMELENIADLRWLAHGAWQLQGITDPVYIFEVGREGQAPLQVPSESETTRRLLIQPQVEGWRPAPDLKVPGRPHWNVESRLGEGGFGEAWLVRHVKTQELRCFKFCFDAERLRALQREITLFRLLKEELGERNDINRLLDWNLDEPPYFIESEYTHIGDLSSWAQSEGGLHQMPLKLRLDIVAQIAEALAAAHSVGVIHKDVKPSNVLIHKNVDGSFQAQLADFGIGQVTERERLAAAGITILGLSRRDGDNTTSGQNGTPLYLAPELLEGRPPTLQSDIYSLGVLLYQVVVGDFGRALAPGWRREIGDHLLANDIGSFVDGIPERRPDHANEVAQRLRTLEQRRQDYQKTMEAQKLLHASQRRQMVYKAVFLTSLVALVAVSILAAWALRAGQKERKARKTTDKVLDHMVNVFDATDPYSVLKPGEKRGEAMTAREILDRGIARVGPEFVEEPLVLAHLKGTYGRIYRSLGVYAEAQSLQEQALAEHINWLGSDNPRTLQSMHHLGITLRSRGEYGRSKEILKSAFEGSKKVLGARSPTTLTVGRDFARTLFNLGEFAEARRLQEPIVEMMRQTLGDEHPDTLSARNDLAYSLEIVGEHDKARYLQQSILEIQSRILGDEHPETIRTMSNLAISIANLGELEKARHLQEQALKATERILGLEHPDSLLRMQTLAMTLHNLGEYSEAIRLGEEVLEIRTRVLGVSHPDTLWTMTNLSYSLPKIGRYEEALKILKTLLPEQKRILGDNHAQTLHSLGNLSLAFSQSGNLQEAEKIQAEVAVATRSHLGEKHLLFLGSIRKLGEIISLRGDLEKAQRTLEEALDLHMRALPVAHPATQEVRFHLSGVLLNLGETQKAKRTAQLALEGLETKIGPRRPLTTQVIRRLLEIARHEKDPEATERWLGELQWLTEIDETDIGSIQQQETRQFVLDVMQRTQGKVQVGKSVPMDVPR